MQKKSNWFLLIIVIVSIISIGSLYAWGSLGYSGFGMIDYYPIGTPSTEERLSTEHVEKKLHEYLSLFFDDSFYVEEIMEFNRNYYAQIGRDGDENLAFELIIDPYKGQITPEPGPNMRWNRSFGHMRWRFWNINRKMTVSETEAIDAAQRYLKRIQAGVTTDGHADRFNGYYTIHTINEQGIAGMLSVHGNSSKVWYHDWNGDYLGDNASSLNAESSHS